MHVTEPPVERTALDPLTPLFYLASAILLLVAAVQFVFQLAFVAGAVRTTGRVVGFERQTYARVSERYARGRVVYWEHYQAPVIAYGPHAEYRWTAPAAPWAPARPGEAVALAYRASDPVPPRYAGPRGLMTALAKVVVAALLALAAWLLAVLNARYERHVREERHAHHHPAAPHVMQ